MLRYTDLVYGIMKNLTLYGAATLSHNLTGLDEFRNYSLEAIGFTKKGLGPGIVTVAVTDQDSKLRSCIMSVVCILFLEGEKE